MLTYKQNKQIHEIYQSYTTLDFKYYIKQKKLLDETEKWKLEFDTNKQQITEHNKLLKESQQTLAIIEENIKRTDTENDCLHNLNLLSAHTEYLNQLTALKHCIYQHNLTIIDNSLSVISKNKQFSEKLSYWQEVLNNKPLFEKKIQIIRRIEQLSQKITQLSIDLEKHKTIYDIFQTKNQHIKRYESLIDSFEARHNSLELLHKLLSNFRLWLYTTIVIPQITDNINQITSVVTQCSDFSLKGVVCVKNKNIDIDWFIDSPSGLATIGKSGGFRKYIYGLIMRISLTRMGCSRINNTQLFIDEGFTSADAFNLTKMCDFLSNLTDFFPNGIIIASHLQPIKDCSNISMHVEKNSDMTARINFGNKQLINQPKKKIMINIKKIIR